MVVLRKPLAIASPIVETTSLVKNVEDEAKKQYSVVALGYWKNQAVKKSVGTSLENLKE